MLESSMVIDQDVYVGRQTIQNFDDEIDDCLLSLEDESLVFGTSDEHMHYYDVTECIISRSNSASEQRQCRVHQQSRSCSCNQFCCDSFDGFRIVYLPVFPTSEIFEINQ